MIREKRTARYWEDTHGTLHRTIDPNRHKLTKAEKKRIKKQRHPHVPWAQRHNHPIATPADMEPPDE